MSHIDEIFSGLRARRAKAIMPFVVGGHPCGRDGSGEGSEGFGVTAGLLAALERGGASVVEIGVPFSDPIADGPVIAAAMHEALQGKVGGGGAAGGVTPRSVFAEVARARAAGVKVGVVLMVSVSIVWRLTPAGMIAWAKESGVDGFIFPDVPVDESEALAGEVRDAGLSCSLLVAPSTSAVRAERIVKASSGFVYLLARAGITGESAAMPEIGPRVRMLREMTDLPIACGFGIGTAEHVRHVVHAGGADAAIVGSALVRELSAASRDGRDVALAAEGFVRELARGLV